MLCREHMFLNTKKLLLRYVTRLVYDLSIFFWVNEAWSLHHVCVAWLSSSGCLLQCLYLLVGPAKQVQVSTVLALNLGYFSSVVIACMIVYWALKLTVQNIDWLFFSIVISSTVMSIERMIDSCRIWSVN